MSLIHVAVLSRSIYWEGNVLQLRKLFHFDFRVLDSRFPFFNVMHINGQHKYMQSCIAIQRRDEGHCDINNIVTGLYNKGISRDARFD